LPRLGLKTRGGLKAAHGIIGELASRRSVFMKVSWQSDAINSTWTTSPLWLSDLGKKSRGILGMCNSLVNKDRGLPRQPSLPPNSFG
jgi:hypothetical protein